MLSSYILTFKHKSYVIGIILVLSTFIMIHMTFFENFSRYIVKNEKSVKLFKFIKNSSKKIEVVSIGTSHTGDALHYQKKIFFNYGASSTWYPEVAYAKASHVLKYVKNLKVLLLEVDHISVLSYDSTLHPSLPNKFFYLLTNVENRLIEDSNHNITKDSNFMVSLKSNVAPVIHRKLIQEYLLHRGKQKEKINHWADLLKQNRINSAKKRVESYRLNEILTIDPLTKEYYRKIITEAKKKNIEVYLIYYPQTKEYLDAIKSENNLILNTFVHKLAEDYQIKVLDYRHIFENNISMFANQDHINQKASVSFTQKVFKDIKMDIQF